MTKDATASYRLSEQEWRSRYGLSPRIQYRGFSVARFVITWHRWRSRLSFPNIRSANAQSRNKLLVKASLFLLMATWLLGSSFFIWQMSDADDWVSDRYASVLRFFGSAPDIPNGPAFDSIAADFAAANEVSLVALRGYVLTGSAGFRTEWRQAIEKRRSAEAEIERNAYLWTDGEKLIQLRGLQKSMETLAENEKLVASLVGTSNRYPGLRLYNEDVQPALVRAIELCNDAIKSLLTLDKSSAAIGELAELRGHIRVAAEGLSSFLHSGISEPPPELVLLLAEITKAPDALDKMHASGLIADEARTDRLAELLRKGSVQINDIVILKRTARWDYADYAFKQKVLPPTEQILAVIRKWRLAEK